MRVALVISSLQAGGAERVMSTLANALAPEHEVRLVKLSHLDDHYQLDGRVVSTVVRPRSRFRLLRITLDKVRLVRSLRATLREFQPDGVISFLDYTNAITLLATRWTQIPVIISERIDPREHRLVRSHSLLRWLTYRWADRLVVQTESVAEWGRKAVDPTRVRIVPNPVAFRASLEDQGAARQKQILGIGRLTQQKGFDVLIRAFADVAELHPEWRLRILGDGPERRELLALIEQEDLSAKVELPGIVDDVRGELVRAGMFVLSSRFEGFPNALLEALATATPCITTDCPSGPGEIVKDGVNALVVPIDDVTAMAHAIQRLIESRSTRLDLGSAGWREAEKYAVDVIAQRWVAILQEIRR